MLFSTKVDIEKSPVQIEPMEPMLFVGSCFADSIGHRFLEERFSVTVNPFGVMYNPASIFHTVEQWLEQKACQTDCLQMPRIAFLTLGTNHVYRLRETGEIVDNCQKRPQRLFHEEELSIEQCVDFLSHTVEELRLHRTDIQVILTVSPIRYAKYGFHGSQLSKATLLLAAEQLTKRYSCVTYFPAYEIVLDELRDYRFYQPDMLHPSSQAVDYIWERIVESYLSPRARSFLDEWQPIKQALGHRPFNPDSTEYQQFLASAKAKEQELMKKYKNTEKL